MRLKTGYKRGTAIIVTTDVPKVPPILTTEANIAAFKGRDATAVFIIVYLTKLRMIFVTAAITPMRIILLVLSFDLRAFSKTR